MSTAIQPWVLILAGADASRLLAPLSESIPASSNPTHARHAEGPVLLRDASLHALGVTDAAHTLVIGSAGQREQWLLEVPALAGSELLVQPAHTGTAVAMLQVLNHLLERERDPYLVVISARHRVEDGAAWRVALRGACEAAANSFEQVVLIGVPPANDLEHDWLVPGPRAVGGTHPVVGFVARPGRHQAAQLMRQGALRCTSTFAASAQALLRVFMHHGEEMVEEYSDSLCLRELEPASVPVPHSDILARDFVRDILERGPEDVRVLPCPECGWTDLGVPRLMASRTEARLAFKSMLVA